MDTDYEDDDLYDDNVWWCAYCDEYTDPIINGAGFPLCPDCGREMQGI